MEERKKLGDFLKNSVSVFSELSLETLNELGPFLEEKKYSRGHVVYRQNDPVEGVYIIIEGKLKVQ